MPRGGARPGAGRKTGSGWRSPKLRAVSRARMAELVESGRDPLVVLVDFAFDESLDVGIRLQAATAAAPYLHPRLSMQAVESTSIRATVDGASVMQALMDRLGRLAPPQTTIEAVAEPVSEAA
jgi:hypothetical protein